MKTTPMEHQVEAQRRLDLNPIAYALACEQGTGKTWMLLNDIERQYAAGRINAALVIAPKGVHTNWVRREIPAHMSLKSKCEFYKSGAGKRHTAKIEKLILESAEGIKIYAMNIDALNTKKGFASAMRFLRCNEAMMIVDESQRIKTPSSARTKKTITLGDYAVSRRISSGTMISNGPMDAFSQFQFLGNGLLGTTSYRAFVAEYAELLPSSHPLVEHAKERSRGGSKAPPIQIIRTDDITGRPIYRNLDKLSEKMAPFCYRVRKDECLDLPPKVYTSHYYEMDSEQARFYATVKETMRHERDDGEVDLFTALTMVNKLRQIASGFMIIDGVPTRLVEDNPRIKALLEVVQDIEGKFIVWATFKEEAAQIARALRAAGIECVEYHGGVKDKDREIAIDSFQEGTPRAFIGNQQAGGTGLTLTAAEDVIYYSSDYSLDARLQSEDRSHRKGTTGAVRYTDLVAEGTIDEEVALALQHKSAISKEILDAI